MRRPIGDVVADIDDDGHVDVLLDEHHEHHHHHHDGHRLMDRSPYDVLGVSPSASEAEVRRAYLALARRYHPDANPGAEERMRVVNEAWAIIGDRQRRADFDRRGRPAPDPGFRPDDPVDDGFDPRAQPDRPYRPRSAREVRRRGVFTVTPVAVFAGAVATGTAGLFFDSTAIIGAGVLLFSAACIGMVVVLLVALADARRDEG